jgi:uncharacterized protein YcfJ
MKKITLILTSLALSLSASSFTKSEKIRVVSTTPIYQTVVKKTPYQECWEEQISYRNQNYRASRHDNSLGTLIGGVAGGILGNQIGKGRGKTVATVGGAIIGTIVGNNLSRDNHHYNAPPSYQTRQRCTTRYTESYEKKFVGYKHIAYFHGKKVVKVIPHKQKFITITKTFHY